MYGRRVQKNSQPRQSHNRTGKELRRTWNCNLCGIQSFIAGGDSINVLQDWKDSLQQIISVRSIPCHFEKCWTWVYETIRSIFIFHQYDRNKFAIQYDGAFCGSYRTLQSCLALNHQNWPRMFYRKKILTCQYRILSKDQIYIDLVQLMNQFDIEIIKSPTPRVSNLESGKVWEKECHSWAKKRRMFLHFA